MTFSANVQLFFPPHSTHIIIEAMFALIYTLLIFPVIYVWGRAIWSAGPALIDGAPIYTFAPYIFHPGHVGVPVLCGIVFYAIQLRIRTARVIGMIAAVVLILAGPNFYFDLIKIVHYGGISALPSFLLRPIPLLWIGNFILLIICLNVRPVQKVFNTTNSQNQVSQQNTVRFVARLRNTAFAIFFIGLVFIQWIGKQGFAPIMVPTILVGLLVCIMADGWIDSKGSWDVSEYPVSHRLILFFLFMMAVMAWSALTIRQHSGGQSLSPNVYFMFIAAGILSGFLTSFFEIVKNKDFSIKGILAIGGISLVLSIIFIVAGQSSNLSKQDLAGMSTHEAPARRCYLFGQCHDIGVQEFGGWGATILLSTYFLIHMIYIFTAAMFITAGCRYLKDKKTG